MHASLEWVLLFQVLHADHQLYLYICMSPIGLRSDLRILCPNLIGTLLCTAYPGMLLDILQSVSKYQNQSCNTELKEIYSAQTLTLQIQTICLTPPFP